MTPVVARALGAIVIATVVVGSTGGLPAVGFWSDAVPAYLSVIVASIGLGLAGIPVLPIILIGRILRRALPNQGRRVDLGLRGVVASVPGTIYFLSNESVVIGDVSLPSQDPNLGVVIVVALAVVAYAFVHLLAGRLQEPEPHPLPPLRSGPTPWISAPPEPTEEFWSPELIEGWRVWTWNGKVLKGAFEHDWASNELEADCVVCDEPPGWDCPCGIYALKDRRLLQPSERGAPIIGSVALSGRVVEHEDGYRASHARIIQLWVDDIDTARRVALSYPDVKVWLGPLPGNPDQKTSSRSPNARADRIP